MTDYYFNEQENLFDSYGGIKTSYGPPMSQAQSYEMQKKEQVQYEKPFRTTHASGVTYS